MVTFDYLPLPALHGFRTCLDDVEQTILTIQRPLDIHRPAVVRFDGQRLSRQLGDLRIVQAKSLLIALVDIDDLYRPDGSSR